MPTAHSLPLALGREPLPPIWRLAMPRYLRPLACLWLFATAPAALAAPTPTAPAGPATPAAIASPAALAAPAAPATPATLATPAPIAKSWSADNGNGTYTNPLFYDEFSDPDIIRVGDDFYLAGTTMHSMPGLVVLHSKDLVNWRWLSYAFDRLTSSGRSSISRAARKPTARASGRRASATTTGSSTSSPTSTVTRCRSSSPPTRPDPGNTGRLEGIHDLSVLFDDDGRVYAVYGYDEVTLIEIKPDLSGYVEGSARVIIPRGNAMGEGHHFYKIGGKYYIISANYAPTGRMQCARADRVDGPYETAVIAARETLGTQRGWWVQQRRPRPAGAGAGCDVRARAARRQLLGRGAPAPGRHRRPAQRRVVGLLDDGLPLGRSHHGTLARDLEGRLAVLRPARQPGPLAAHVDQAGGGRRGRAERPLSAQRRLLRAETPARLAVESQPGGVEVVALREARRPAPAHAAGQSVPVGQELAHPTRDRPRVHRDGRARRRGPPSRRHGRARACSTCPSPPSGSCAATPASSCAGTTS